jgi:hypothetical protein
MPSDWSAAVDAIGKGLSASPFYQQASGGSSPNVHIRATCPTLLRCRSGHSAWRHAHQTFTCEPNVTSLVVFVFRSRSHSLKSAGNVVARAFRRPLVA